LTHGLSSYGSTLLKCSTTGTWASQVRPSREALVTMPVWARFGRAWRIPVKEMKAWIATPSGVKVTTSSPCWTRCGLARGAIFQLRPASVVT
jgi:hypothetical protein